MGSVPVLKPREVVAFLVRLGFQEVRQLATIKRRDKLPEQGWSWCIDVWEQPVRAAGTMLAEVETRPLAELEHLQMPSWAVREITDDAGFSAIALASR